MRNCENRLIFGKVKAYNKMASIFGPPCMFMKLLIIIVVSAGWYDYSGDYLGKSCIYIYIYIYIYLIKIDLTDR